MIYLTQGQPLFDNSGFVVYDPTGYYNDGDTVVCASVGAPDEPACRYEAQYIAYGSIVYSVSDPDQLMAQILAIDPQSLFGKTSQNAAVDQMVQQIVPQSTTDTDAVPTTDQVDTTDTATTTPDIAPPDTTDAPAPSVPDDTSAASTTPLNTSTTTDALPYSEPSIVGEALVAPPPDLSDMASSSIDAATSTQ